jgi:hypothetical protein
MQFFIAINCTIHIISDYMKLWTIYVCVCVCINLFLISLAASFVLQI